MAKMAKTGSMVPKTVNMIAARTASGSNVGIMVSPLDSGRRRWKGKALCFVPKLGALSSHASHPGQTRRVPSMPKPSSALNYGPIISSRRIFNP